jgi:pantetheine-phosphate adenylyltransferase
MSSTQYSFLSSSGVKEIAAFGGALDDLVPQSVVRAFAARRAS